tara:strand:+ start:154 stop:1380 length:1227 start_codon:yes stop_codon:yes gene_type:complete
MGGLMASTNAFGRVSAAAMERPYRRTGANPAASRVAHARWSAKAAYADSADALIGCGARHGRARRRAVRSGLHVVALTQVGATIPAALTFASLAKYSAAGGLGGLVSHTPSVPLDVIKTKLQTSPEKYKGMDMWQIGREIVRTEGVGSIFTGAGSTAVGFTLHGVFKYSGFEALKFMTFKHGGGVKAGDALAMFCQDHRIQTLLFAGAIAELFSTLILCPLEQTKIKMISDPNYADGWVDGVQRLIREEGWEGIANTLPVIWTKTIPYTMFQLCTYDIASASLRSWANGLPFEPPSLALQLPAALLAAVIASLASQPGDTLMSTFNGECPEGAEECPGFEFIDENGDFDEEGMAECKKPKRRALLETAVGLGPVGLMLGWKERLAHTTLIVVIQLTVYDNIKRALFSS